MPDKISFIHTADLHLGRSFQDLGRKGAGLRQRLLAALDRIVALALDRGVDLVLIAGDLFDSPLPAPAALSALDSAFSRLAGAGVRVVVMPGTHDPPGARAFAAPVFSAWPRRVVVLTPESPFCLFEELDLAVCAWFPARDRAREWIGPAEGWHRGRRFRVAMAHGSVLSGLGAEGPEDLVPAAILRDPEVQYLALGHHHGARLVAEARMPAYYAGAPEMLAFDQKDAGYALHVTLTARGSEVEVNVDRARVGVLHYQRLEAAGEELISGRDLARELDKLADPDLCLEIIVSGLVPLEATLPDLASLERDHADKFFKLRLHDRAERSRELASLPAAAEASVLAEFVRRMQARIEASADAERAEWEEALRLGLHFLAGSDPRP
jgi:DNA repair protein SbcD/Mre11